MDGIRSILALGILGATAALARAQQPAALSPFDLLITEVMADPSPGVGLPEVEYVEVYNASGRAVELGTVELRRGVSAVSLPDTVLAPDAYLALAEAGILGDPRFFAWDDLPVLTNSGVRLALLSEEGRTLDAVEYDPRWHAPGLRDGGYALERVDLSLPCVTGQANWATSTALAGGTPGTGNAVASRLEVDSLRVVALSVGGDTAARVITNRALEPEAAAGFTVRGARVGEVRPVAGELGVYELVLAEPLTPGEVADLALATTARSCASAEAVSRERVAFGLPLRPAPGDWAINELLYDPPTGEGRYVELVNRGAGLLSSSDVRLARLDAAGAVDDLFASERAALVPPGGYLVLADDRASLLARFPGARASDVLGADVPTLGNEACLLLFDPAGDRELERVCYTAAWHNRAYANTDGIALERIDAGAPANRASNWSSAAVSAGGGTPTRANSQSAGGGTPVLPEGTYALDSERVSPDGDGYEDLLTVRFRFAEAGTLVNFGVYDLNGRPVYTSAEDVSAGRAGTWTWDGVGDDGDVAPVGTYVLRASSFGDGRQERVEHIAFSVLGRI